MTEEHPDAERRADDARRAALMFTALGFAALPRVPADMAPVFGALHRWLDSWRGIGDLVTGMNRQAYDLELTQYPHGWRCTFFVTGQGTLPHAYHRLGLGEDVLKSLRREMGLRELAKKAKVPPGYLAELEAGLKKNPSLAVLRKLAKARGVPVTELLG